MKKLIPILLLTIVYKNISAQTDTLKLSLSQAIETGLKNRYDLQADKYNIAIMSNTISKNKKEWIPEIAATGNARYSPQLQATYIPGGFLGPEPGLVALGANATSVFSLELNEDIFKPGIFTDVAIAKNNLEIQKEKNKQNENLVREKIIESYLNVLLKELQYNIQTDNEQRYKEYQAVAEGKFKFGTMVENDFLKAALDYENSKVETQKAKQSYELAFINLKYQINVAPESQLKLSEKLNSNNYKNESKNNAINRVEIKQLLLQKVETKLELSKIRQNALPTFGIFANYSKQFTYTRFDYGNNQWWSPFSYVGLRVSMPITSNFKNYNSRQEYILKSKQLDDDLKQKTADIAYEVNKATIELENTLKNMKTSENNYKLSKNIYENLKLQYGHGSILYSNLLDTERSLSTIEQNYIKSVYDYLVAQINYQKAIGNYGD